MIHYHSLLTKVSHGKRKMIGKRKTSAGLRRILSCSHRPRLWSKLPGFQTECACPDESCYRANRFCKLYRTWLKRHRFSRERKFMRDKKRIGGRERSLYLISFFSFCERPLLARNRHNEPSMCDTHHLLKSWNWYSKEAWENSQHFATPPLVSTRNDFWQTSAEIPY